MSSGVLLPEASEWIGRSVTYAPYPVTAIDIAKFCYSVGIDEAVHFSLAEAQRHGHPSVIAPLGFHVVVRHAAPNLMPLSTFGEDGTPEDLVPPSRATRRMAGESRARFHVPIYAGDVVTLTTYISGMREKQGSSGAFAVVAYELSYRNQKGHEVVTEHYARILR